MNILGYVLIGFVIIVALKIYSDSDYMNLKCIISNVDGERYCVRERSKLELAADRLATVNTRMKKLVNHVGNKYEEDNVTRLVNGFNPEKIYETLPTSEYTAYSQNKGEKLAFCLDTEKQSKGRLIDHNTLTFVAIHELAHIATISTGHTPEFWDNFKFLLKEAVEINVYEPEDYKKKAKRYCGMNITDNPYYDM